MGIKQSKEKFSVGATCIKVRPSFDCRKSQLITNEHSEMITHKSFVTNNHILVQFNEYKVA